MNIKLWLWNMHSYVNVYSNTYTVTVIIVYCVVYMFVHVCDIFLSILLRYSEPIRSVSRDTRDHTVHMDFFMHIPETPGGPNAAFHPSEWPKMDSKNFNNTFKRSKILFLAFSWSSIINNVFILESKINCKYLPSKKKVCTFHSVIFKSLYYDYHRLNVLSLKW